jgi:chorismate binding enzyme/Anthranilate synthase component I, N terminal region
MTSPRDPAVVAPFRVALDSGLAVVAPFRVALDSGLAPDQAVGWLRGDRRPVALVGEWPGGLAVLGSEPARVAAAHEDPFALLDVQPEIAPGEAAVGSGWIGWLGYGLGARIERLPPSPPAPVVRPAFSLAFYDHVVVHDGERWWFEGLWSAERDAVLRELRAVWEARLRELPAPVGTEGVRTPFALSSNGAAGHVAAVADCRRRIAMGELYQANLCARLEARYEGEALDLFARALSCAEPRFGALLDGVVSLSPERFLRRKEREDRRALSNASSSSGSGSESATTPPPTPIQIYSSPSEAASRARCRSSATARPSCASTVSKVPLLVDTDGAVLEAAFGVPHLVDQRPPPSNAREQLAHAAALASRRSDQFDPDRLSEMRTRH